MAEPVESRRALLAAAAAAVIGFGTVESAMAVTAAKSASCKNCSSFYDLNIFPVTLIYPLIDFDLCP